MHTRQEASRQRESQLDLQVSKQPKCKCKSKTLNLQPIAPSNLCRLWAAVSNRASQQQQSPKLTSLTGGDTISRPTFSREGSVRSKRPPPLKIRKLDYNQLNLNPEGWSSLSPITMSARTQVTSITARKGWVIRRATMSIPCLTTSDS